MKLNLKIVLIPILYFGFSSILYSQYLTNRRVDWKKIETHIDDSLRYKYLKKIAGNEYASTDYLFSTSNYISTEAATQFYSEESSKYHFLDINRDGFLDIIYEGRNPVGIEQDNLIFYINSNDSLRVAMKVPGYIEKLTIQNGQILSMQSIINRCCFGFACFRNYYAFNRTPNCSKEESNEGDFSYACYFSDLLKCRHLACEALDYYVMPPNDNLRIKLMSKNSFYLTLDPHQVVNKKKPGYADLSYTFDGSNQIGKFNCRTDLTILSEFATKTGENYSFVKVKNRDSIQSIFGEMDCYIYGWVNTEYLK